LVLLRTKLYGGICQRGDVTVMTLGKTEDRVGERIRLRRQELGKSLREVSGLAGISHSHLMRIEKGQVPAANRFQLAGIAQALKCPVDYLTGVVVPAGPDHAEVSSAVYDTTRALLAADLDFDPEPAADLASLDALVERFDAAIDMRQKCQYAALARRLPALIRDLYDATAGEHRGQALAMLARTAEAASFAVRYLGDPGAAVIASDRARQASLVLDDPVLLGYGEWARAHSALGCGLYGRAVQLSTRAVNQLDGLRGHLDGHPEMLGMMHLTLAFSLVGAGRFDDAQAPLDEARTLARMTGETDTFGLMFGPTNVSLWNLAILTDGGDPVDAMPLISGTNVQLIPSPSRQVCFYTDAARALVRAGEYDRAVQFFEAGERIAPERMHGDPIIVESVRGLVDTAHRRAVSTRLRGLAFRVGVSA
jgi:transcriptional regulator with XRE-family HTH domain